MNINEARDRVLGNTKSLEGGKADFLSGILSVIRILQEEDVRDPSKLFSQSVAPHYELMRALSPSLGKMSRDKRILIISFLEERIDRWRRSSHAFEQYEFMQFRRMNRVIAAASLLQVSPDELERRLTDCPRDLLAPDVIAYVIWETLAYIHSLIGYWNVDALAQEYPWISVLTRDKR